MLLPAWPYPPACPPAPQLKRLYEAGQWAHIAAFVHAALGLCDPAALR